MKIDSKFKIKNSILSLGLSFKTEIVFVISYFNWSQTANEDFRGDGDFQNNNIPFTLGESADYNGIEGINVDCKLSKYYYYYLSCGYFILLNIEPLKVKAS